MPVVGLMQAARQVWELSDNDRIRLTSLHGTLRHVSRRIRMASLVAAIGPDDTRMEIRSRDGQSEQWSFDRRENTVTYTHSGQSGILADHIESVRFVGLSLTGTPTRIPAEIQSILCTVSVRLEEKQQ